MVTPQKYLPESALNQFIRAAQYLSSLPSITHFWDDVHQIFKQFYKANGFALYNLMILTIKSHPIFMYVIVIHLE